MKPRHKLGGCEGDIVDPRLYRREATGGTPASRCASALTKPSGSASGRARLTQPCLAARRGRRRSPARSSALGRQDSPAHGEGSARNRGSNLRIVGWKFRSKVAKLFRMMVATDGVEPPTLAFSVLPAYPPCPSTT